MIIEEVIKSAENGDIGAMLTLGQYYVNDENRDLEKAKKWYVMAAEHNVPHAAHMAALLGVVDVQGSDLVVNSSAFEPLMVPAIYEDCEEAYKWLTKTIEYKNMGSEDLANVDLEELQKKRDMVAWKCGVYCFFMGKYDEAINWVKGLRGSWSDLVYGVSSFQKATEDGEYGTAIPYMDRVVNDREFLAIKKNNIEESMVCLAGLYVGHSYQHGIVLTSKPDFDKAIEVLRTVQASLKNSSEKEKLESKIAEVQEMRVQSSGTQANNANSSGGGCYVATAVYGSYDCPQVWTLRRYRDDILASTWYGRAFIRTYYAISPTLVKWFGDTEWFKKMWRAKLDSMVISLQDKGVENTPYNDKKW